MPLNDLSVGVVVTIAVERVRVEQTTHGVSSEISTVRVEFTPIVFGLDVDQALVNESDDLDVVRGLRVLNTLKGTRGDNAGTMAGLGAPCHLFPLGVSDEGVFLRGSPQAEV